MSLLILGEIYFSIILHKLFSKQYPQLILNIHILKHESDNKK